MFGPVTVVAVDGEQDAAILDAPFEAFRFVFGNSHSNERSSHAADRTARSDSRQGGDQGPGSDKRSEAGNGDSANSDQPPERSAEHSPGCHPGGRPFRSLRAFFKRKIFRTHVFREEHGDVRVSETGLFQRSDAVLGREPVWINSEYCRVGHRFLLPG